MHIKYTILRVSHYYGLAFISRANNMFFFWARFHNPAHNHLGQISNCHVLTGPKTNSFFDFFIVVIIIIIIIIIIVIIIISRTSNNNTFIFLLHIFYIFTLLLLFIL